jgi:threonine dehydrogenase-like Zn-dependent dehydrogenase
MLDIRQAHSHDDATSAAPGKLGTTVATHRIEGCCMRAMAVFPEKRDLRIIDLPLPEAVGERDVTVRVREVGICGTDREICGFHYGTPPSGLSRLVLGHEALGEVVAVGPSVRTLHRGDLVAFTVRRPCDDAACVACRAGRQDFCVTGNFHERGIKEADGFLTELVVEDERYLVRVPRSLADVGVLVEPLTIAAKAAVDLETVLRRYPWEATGLRALVLGAGPIGLLGAMMLVARNDIETFVYSLEPADSDRARLVRSFGAEYVSARDVGLTDLSSRIGAFDVMFEAVGTAKVAFLGLDALAPNGVFIFSGVPGGGKRIEIDLDGIMGNIVLKNQILFGTVNASRAAFEASVRQLEQFMTLFPDAVRSLITERARLEDAPALLQRPGGIKQVVALAA